MKKQILVMALVLVSFKAWSFGPSEGGGGSRFSYDGMKIQTLIASPELESAFFKVHGSTLDGIELQGIDNTQRIITYDVRSNNCHLTAQLTWDDGMRPNYRVVSVSEPICQ